MSFTFMEGEKLYPWTNGSVKVVTPTHELCKCVAFDKGEFSANRWCRACRGTGVVEIDGLPQCLSWLRGERWRT